MALHREILQLFQGQNFDPCGSRFFGNIHEFTGLERVRDILAGWTGWAFDRFDLQQPRKSELPYTTFLQMTLDNVGELVKYGGHLLFV